MKEDFSENIVKIYRMRSDASFRTRVDRHSNLR